jgi:hypothetical protein
VLKLGEVIRCEQARRGCKHIVNTRLKCTEHFESKQIHRIELGWVRERCHLKLKRAEEPHRIPDILEIPKHDWAVHNQFVARLANVTPQLKMEQKILSIARVDDPSKTIEYVRMLDRHGYLRLPLFKKGEPIIAPAGLELSAAK